MNVFLIEDGGQKIFKSLYKKTIWELDSLKY